MKVQKILYILLSLICIGIYIYDIVINNADPTNNLMKVILVIVCCVLGILRGNSKQRRASLSFYEKSYSKELQNAFSSEKKERKQLLCAVRFYDEDKLKKAVKILLNLKEKCKSSDDYYAVGLFLALCFTDMQFYEGALNEYEEILSRRLETSTIYNNLGHFHSTLGKKKEAMEYYEKSLTLSPENEYTYVNIANIYFADKEFNSAITYALKALEINSKQTSAANLLAIIYALKEEKENADKYFHVAITSGSDPDELRDAIEYYKS